MKKKARKNKKTKVKLSRCNRHTGIRGTEFGLENGEKFLLCVYVFMAASIFFFNVPTSI